MFQTHKPSLFSSDDEEQQEDIEDDEPSFDENDFNDHQSTSATSSQLQPDVSRTFNAGIGVCPPFSDAKTGTNVSNNNTKTGVELSRTNEVGVELSRTEDAYIQTTQPLYSVEDLLEEAAEEELDETLPPNDTVGQEDVSADTPLSRGSGDMKEDNPYGENLELDVHDRMGNDSADIGYRQDGEGDLDETLPPNESMGQEDVSADLNDSNIDVDNPHSDVSENNLTENPDEVMTNDEQQSKSHGTTNDIYRENGDIYGENIVHLDQDVIDALLDTTVERENPGELFRNESLYYDSDWFSLYMCRDKVFPICLLYECRLSWV